MMPIGRRILEARNDAKMAGHKPIKARISPRDMQELESWVRQQNRPHVTGLPTQTLSSKWLWGMHIEEDPTVKDIVVLEMAKP
jgi:hypothetical protein